MIGQDNISIIPNTCCPQGNREIVYFGENPYFTLSDDKLNIRVIPNSYLDYILKGGSVYKLLEESTADKIYVALSLKDLLVFCLQLFNKHEEAIRFYTSYIESYKKLLPYNDDLFNEPEFVTPIFERVKYSYYVHNSDINFIKLSILPYLNSIPKIKFKDHAILVAKVLDFDRDIKNIIKGAVKDLKDKRYPSEYGEKYNYEYACKYVGGYYLSQKESYNKYMAFNEIAGKQILKKANDDDILMFLNPLFSNTQFFSNFLYIKRYFKRTYKGLDINTLEE